MILWDANAGLPVRPTVAAAFAAAIAADEGNPSSLHTAGRAARRRLDDARERTAARLGCRPREIVFTASGSESAALAVLGAYRSAARDGRRRVVTSSIEHPCVLGAVARLEALGAEVLRLAPGESGRIPDAALDEALTPETSLCALMAANNETGVVQPARLAARLCAERGIILHCDAVQAPGRLPCTLADLPVDLLSLSGHKLGAPAGIGALFWRRGLALEALVPGHQEGGLRGGTPSAALAEAFATALEERTAERPLEAPRLAALRDRFEARLAAAVPEVAVNGAGERLCNTSNVRFGGVDGAALLVALDLEGVCASSGAACASGTPSPSHVLRAMGLSATQARSSLRFSLGPSATDAQVDAVVAILARVVPRLRDEAWSPRPLERFEHRTG